MLTCRSSRLYNHQSSLLMFKWTLTSWKNLKITNPGNLQKLSCLKLLFNFNNNLSYIYLLYILLILNIFNITQTCKYLYTNLIYFYLQIKMFLLYLILFCLNNFHYFTISFLLVLIFNLLTSWHPPSTGKGFLTSTFL